MVDRFVRAGQLGFTDPAAAWAWYVVQNTPRVTAMVLETEARRLDPTNPATGGVQALLSADDFRDNEYVRNQIVEWARKQTFRSAMDAAIEAWNSGKEDEAMRLMDARISEMNAIRLDFVDRGWFFEELDERQERRAFIARGEDYFPLGIDPIDQRMYGGLSYTELEIPFGYSGVGKSFYCVHRGFVATRMRRKVLHLVLEGGRKKIEDRYEARYSNTLYRAVRSGDFDAKALYTIQREYAIYRRGLVLRGFADVREWQVTITDIKAELGELRNTGWVPDLIIVDYGDLVWAEGDNATDRQKNAFRQLKTLAEQSEFRGHKGYAICAPAQAQRPKEGAERKTHVLQPSQVADCYEKTRIADVVISINRTDWEQENQRARLYLGKYRDNEDHLLVRIETDYTYGGFAVLGKPEPPVLPPPPTKRKKP